ncbi:MAG TPA: M14 family zinc carboxypeptidase [Ignavibacteriaceae bacterium]|nr:M14 family zinc carboxypeptidase [Ignavibacteriaceae bacterium]
MIKIFLILLIFSFTTYSQSLQTPLEKNNYQSLTTYKELTSFLDELNKNALLKSEIIGTSVDGRNLYVVKVSTGEFGSDNSKIKVLIFAQQHGDEQSGKEGSLLLLKEIAEGKLDYLFEKIDLLLVPQMNPDGSEKDKRRNANDADLNRNHLILTQPETIALHKLFDQYLPEASMDVHEYSPYSEEWEKFGYLKNFDEQVGTTTNLNVSEKIRKFSNEEYLPFIKSFFEEKNFTFHNYIPGGPPEVELIRFSTYDVNDGRQSFGAMNTFSFIQEGKNGKDSLDNIKKRAEGQATGMKGFLEFIYSNKDKIKSLVVEERNKLINGKADNKVALQMDHISNGEKLNLSLLSMKTNTDTIITVNDFRPVVKSLYDVERPKGYLIPKNLPELYDWAIRQNLFISEYENMPDQKIEEYFITEIDSINFEGDIVVNPKVELKEIKNKINEQDYYFIPTKQLKSNLIVIALEPKSMLGLVTYKNFEHLLKRREYFPILRVEN